MEVGKGRDRYLGADGLTEGWSEGCMQQFLSS